MSTLYDADILVWSEQQAALLRRLAAGERVNDAVDWPNVIEELESVGRSQLSAVRSHLVQAMAHMLKVQAWPHASAVPGWQAEAVQQRQEAAEAFTPAMRQKIDTAKLYRDALRRLPAPIDGQPPLPLPAACPWTLDALLAEEP